MNIFPRFNREGAPCLICQTCEEGQATLIPIDGTETDFIEEAIQVHVECLNLRLHGKMIYHNGIGIETKVTPTPEGKP